MKQITIVLQYMTEAPVTKTDIVERLYRDGVALPPEGNNDIVFLQVMTEEL